MTSAYSGSAARAGVVRDCSVIADTRDALRQEAGRRGIPLGDDVLDYILVRFARDLKSLMHLLHRLDGFALAEKRAVTVPLLKRMLDEEQAEQQADLQFRE